MRYELTSLEEQFKTATEEDSKRDEGLSERISSLNEKVETYAEKTTSSLEGLDEKYQKVKTELKKINLKKSENEKSDELSGARSPFFKKTFLFCITEDQ